MQLSKSLDDTKHIAEEFAKQFKDSGGLILLSGNLGAGKTTFTQSFIKSFGVSGNITSPTFLLTRQYQIPNSDRWIFHLDLYRLVEPINLSETGIREIIDSTANNIILIEWSEKIKSQLNDYKYFEVSLKKVNDDQREITISNPFSQDR